MSALTGRTPNCHKTDLEDHNRPRHQGRPQRCKGHGGWDGESWEAGLAASSWPWVQSLSCTLAFPSQPFKKSSSLFWSFIDHVLPPTHTGPVVEGESGRRKRRDVFPSNLGGTWRGVEPGASRLARGRRRVGRPPSARRGARRGPG